jgi:nucleoside-diphosphate-sugar epimerase
MKKVIITGATGMVGKGILLECLDHQEVDEVLVIGRSTIGMKHQKLKEIIKKDFSDFADVADQTSRLRCLLLRTWHQRRRTERGPIP